MVLYGGGSEGGGMESAKRVAMASHHLGRRKKGVAFSGRPKPKAIYD